MKSETGFAPINNTKLYFEMVGTGKPLLLLHSGLTDHRMWAEQASEFSKQFQVIMPDFRGYGRSDIPEEPFRHARDIYDFIIYLGLKCVNVAGCSLGGTTAMELAITHPEMVERLILIAPGLAGYEYRDKQTLAKDIILEGLINDGKKEEVIDMMLDIWLMGLSRVRSAVNSGTIALVRKMIADNYSSVTDKFPETELEFSVISKLGEIKAPTLVMVGDCDLPDMLAISELVSHKIKGAKIQILSNTAHLPNLEHGSLFNQSVIEFLAAG